MLAVEILRGIGEDLQTQDNRSWADPIFIVQHKVPSLDRWEFVTAAFTEKACQRYIERNQHNLNDPQIHAASGHRNDEWIQMRAALIALAEEDENG